MNAIKADPAVSSIVGTHYTPIEIERLYPRSNSMRWGREGRAELLDEQGQVLATFEADEGDDESMEFRIASLFITTIAKMLPADAIKALKPLTDDDRE